MKNILSCVNFTGLFNYVSLFSEFSLDIFKKGINSPLLPSARYCKWRKNVLTCLEKYVNQIDTRTYGDYTINENCFSQDIPFQI